MTRSIIAALSLLLAAPSFAQEPTVDPSPKFGGCLKDGSTCFGPSVSINLLSISLRNGAAQTDVVPGVGYGVVWNAKAWNRIGLSGYVNLRATPEGKAPVFSVVGSFAEYLNIGLAYQVGGSEASSFRDAAAILLGLGTTFGAK